MLGRTSERSEGTGKAELENISDLSRETQTWSRATAGVISCHFIQFGQSSYRAATQPGQYPVIEIRYVKRNNTRGEGATNCLHWTAGCMVGISAVNDTSVKLYIHGEGPY